MRAVTYQDVREVRVEERPEPELKSADEAIVAISASGICGSDLHIYHGRVKIEPGLHDRARVRRHGARGRRRRDPGGARRPRARVLSHGLRDLLLLHAGRLPEVRAGPSFGHGAALGELQGTQAERTLVPMANMTLRQVPESVADDVALFAGDVMGTAYHAIDDGGVRAGRQRRGARAWVRSACARSRSRGRRGGRAR